MKVDAARAIEMAIEAEIAQAMNEKASGTAFFANLSLHEYEALLFSDPQQLASVTHGKRTRRKVRGNCCRMWRLRADQR